MREAQLQRQQGERVLEETRRQTHLSIRPYIIPTPMRGAHPPDGTFRFEYAGDLRDQWISAIGVFQISWFAEYTISSTSEMSRAFLGR